MPERPHAGAANAGGTITINRAPVLTLWAAVVAERRGYDRDEAVTLGRAVAGLNAAAKAFTLYEAFRPAIPCGVRGWGAKGVLDLALIGSLAPKGRGPR